MRIYAAPGEGVYTVDANHLKTNVPPAPGPYDTVVQAWDNCGGVGKTAVNITVTANGLLQPRFLCSTDSKDSRVDGYLINPATGVIRPTAQRSIATGMAPGRLASDPSGYRLYVGNVGSKDVSAYFINRNDGSLQPVPGAPSPIGGYPTSIIVHPSGRFVYVTVTVNGSPN